MPSIYEQAQSFRAQLIKRDTAAINYLTAEYRLVYARLLRSLASVNNQINEAQRNGQSVSRSWLNQQERYQTFLRQLDQEFRLYSNTVMGLVQARQVFEAQQGSADAAALLGSFNRLNLGAVQSIVSNLRTDSPLGNLLDSFGAVASQNAASALRDAVALGWNPRKSARQVKEALGVPLARALTISRTESNRAYRQATFERFKESGEVKGYYWVASKSKKTCLACLALDGQFFPLDKPQPCHINCRCSSYAGVKGQPAFTRETGAQWFAKQPDSVKRQMMGASAFDALKSGKVKLQDFVGRADSRKWGSAYYELSLRRALAGEARFPG